MEQGQTTESPDGQPASKIPRRFGPGSDKAYKIPNAVKRKRINFRLRKLITPKAPITVLNEMAGTVSYQFVDNPPMPMVNPLMVAHLYTAQCTIDDEVFTGTGPTKQIAKNICSEHAIQYIVAKRCRDPKNLQQTTEDGKPLKPNQMMDETPWAQLASLALFKLFNDWQAQGYMVPPELLKPPEYCSYQGGPQGSGDGKDQAGQGKDGEVEDAGNDDDDKVLEDLSDVPVTKAAQARAQKPSPTVPGGSGRLPDNPTNRHPVQLLNEVHRGITFFTLEEQGAPPNTIFVIAAEVKGKMYQGEGRSKKDSKKRCAMAILKDLYGVTYPDDGADTPMPPPNFAQAQAANISTLMAGMPQTATPTGP